MDIIFMRHEIDRSRKSRLPKKKSDRLRYKTNKTHWEFKKIIEKTLRIAKEPETIVTSPYLRTRSSVRIFAHLLPDAEILLTETLEPFSDPEDFIVWCRKEVRSSTSRLLVIGHEPHLSLLISLCLVGSYQDCLNIKKGGSVLLHFNGGPGIAKGNLIWAVPPEFLGE